MQSFLTYTHKREESEGLPSFSSSAVDIYPKNFRKPVAFWYISKEAKMNEQKLVSGIAYALAVAFFRGVVVGVKYQGVYPKTFDPDDEKLIKKYADENLCHWTDTAQLEISRWQ